jgi:hypothetical protein
MKIACPLLALTLLLALAAPAAAQETPPPDKETAAKPAAETPAPAKEAPAKAAAPAPPKELSFCAKALVPLADGYKAAYDDMQKWIAEVDTKTGAATEKVNKIEAQIQQNETAITKAKLDGDDAKSKDLTKANKQLWSELETAKKSASEACEGLSKEAGQRVKQYETQIEAKLDECKAKLK